MSRAQLYCGDALAVLTTLPDASVQCCVTSPPYWGLRDYGVAGQLGLEPTPAAYVVALVGVLREVRRVLRDDGTLWLNLGDSYAGGGRGGGGSFDAERPGWTTDETRGKRNGKRWGGGDSVVPDLAAKNLVGVPWRVAFALQQPYYAGTIKDERDRIWLAAMLDAEGCMFIHKRKAGQHNGQGYHRQNDNYGPGLEIANTSLAVVERIMALVGKGSICSQGPGQNERRKQTIYRWNLRTVESRDFVRELYPYLVAKQRQARILYGCPSSGERAAAAHEALKILHKGGETDVDFPAPATLYEPGFYLRSDVIWSKANPMPESVTDRPTKSHEYVFLLSKSATYYYDADAIRGGWAKATVDRLNQSTFDQQTGGPKDPKNGNRSHRKALVNLKMRGGVSAPGYDESKWDERSDGLSRPPMTMRDRAYHPDGPNARTVWEIATQPYPSAHFATFPEELARRCIAAGSRPGDTVLDPFGGSGTVAQVATGNGRDSIYIDLNPAYLELARQRIGPMLCDTVAA